MRAQPAGTGVRDEAKGLRRARALPSQERGGASSFHLPPFPEPGYVLATVELWRRYRLHPARLGYDLSDPLQCSIWTATQLYVDHLETLALSRGLDLYTLTRAEVQELLPVEPRTLESSLWRLKDLVAEEKGDGDALMRLLGEVSTALFGATIAPCSLWIPREFWDSAETGSFADGDGARRRTTWTRGPMHPSCPAQTRATLAPLACMFRRALELAGGGLVTQAEAARRLGLTPRGISLRIAAGRLEAIRVGGTVLVFAGDLVDSSSDA